MNHIYRLCWNRTLRAWVPGSELAKSKGAGTNRSRPATRLPLMLSLLSASLGMSGLAWAGNSPTGGQIVGGSGSITQSGNVTTIRQNSQTLSLNWQSFDIGADQTVDFLQPGRSSIAVNRILGNTASEIYGHLNANGQVWLINPNGVLFGQGAQVDVGGIVASTLDLDDGAPGSGTVRFAGNGRGSVVNRGSINAAQGGYVALLGNTVSNQGTIRAQLGTVALAGGTAMTLTFSGSQLMHVVVDASTVRSLVENRQLIVADGGQVLMTAGARNSLIASAVNNTGTVQAQTVQDHGGTITLLGGMEAGTVNVAGTLDASAPNGGKGGFIETSGAQAHVADGTVITTKAADGNSGTWLVDPTDFTIAASGGDITAATLQSQLASGNVAFSSSNGSGGTSGNVNVNQAVTWSANTTLTLTASNNVVLNAAIKNTGASGKTVLEAGNAFVNNVGASALGGHWAVYSASPAANTLGGLTPGFIQYNAAAGAAAASGATGNGLFYSAAATINIAGFNAGTNGTPSKSYDGTSNLLVSELSYSLVGGGSGDTLTAIAGGYGQSDAGTGLTVTAPTSSAAYTILNGAIPVYGYAVSGTASVGTGAINPAQLIATIVGNPTKVYDGSTTAILTSANYAITGLAAGQSIAVNQPSSVGYASADVNTSGGIVAVNATFASSNFVAGSGTKLSNYVLPTTATGDGTITPAPLYLSGVLTTNKTYDATTADPLDISNASIYGVVNGDNVTLDASSGVGNFANADAGTAKTVTLSGFALAGNATKVADYQLIAPTNLTANIDPKALTVTGVTASGKVYDGTTGATLDTGGATLSGFVNAADQSATTLNAGSAAGTFSQSDVGNHLAVSVSGLTVNNGNYTVTQPAGLTADITPATLTISFSGSADKIYDGTNYATLSTGNFSVVGTVGGQSVTVNQAPAVYTGTDAPNVGTDVVTATLQSSDLSFTNGAKASNYVFNTSVVGSGQILKAPLTISIDGNPTRVYDGVGDTSATLGSGNFLLSGVIPGESITLAGPFAGNYYDTANGDAPNPGSYEGNAGMWGVVAALTAGNFAAGNGTLLSNYALPTQALGYGTITPASLAGYLVTDVTGTKVYDGTTALALAPGDPANHLVFGGLATGDSVTQVSTVTANFASKDVGTQPLSVLGLQASDFSITNGGVDVSGNYTWPEDVYGTGTITPKQLLVSITGNPTKTYNGNTLVLPLSSGNFQVNGWVAGEGATITPTASFNYASANAGSNIAINGTLTQNNYVANSGTLLSNYTLAYNVSGLGTINQAPLYVVGVYADNKLYDTTGDATVEIGRASLAGLADVDKNASAIAVTIGNGSDSHGATSTQTIDGSGAVSGATVSGAFSQANVGSGLAVSTAYSLGGSSAGNYILQPFSLNANITPAPVTVSGITANSKVYDATTTEAGFNTGSATLSGVYASDASSVALATTGLSGTFITPNVGNNLAVNASGVFTLGAGGSGDASGNYYLVQPTGLKANITPAPLSVSITGNPTKVYDGTTSLTLTAGDYTITGWQGGQSATLPQSYSASYASADAASGITVNSTLVTSDWSPASGTMLSNYILPTSATGTGTITPLVLNLTGTRVYDATDTIWSAISGNPTNADNPSAFGTLAGLDGDTFTVTGSGTTSSKNVGTYTGANFGLGTLALQAVSGNAANYTLVGGIDTYTITKAPLYVTGATVATKVYDGSTAASVNGATLTQGNAKGDVLGSDDVTIGSSGIAGTFSNKNAGSGKTVTINTSDVGGTDAGNYQLVQPSGLTGDITQRPVTVSGSRQYDGTAAALGGGATWQTPGAVSGDASSGVVGGDTVTVNGGSGSVASANVGAYNSDGSGAGLFSTTGLTLSNPNYAIASTGNAFTINPHQINITGSSIYNGAATAGATSGSFGGVSIADGSFSTGVNGETLDLGGSYALANGGNVTPNGNGGGTAHKQTTATPTTGGAGLGGLTLADGSGAASNYVINSVNYTVNPVVLSFDGSKVYDGSSSFDAGTVSSLTGGFVGGDQLVVSGTGTLSSANAGSYGAGASGIKGTPTGTAQIGVGGLTLSAAASNAANPANYTLIGGTDTYDITKAVITLTGVRQYDGTASVGDSNVTLINGTPVACAVGNTCWGVSSSNMVAGDLSHLTVSGNGSTVASANAGTYGDGSGFNDSLTLGGTAAGNYTLAATGNQFDIIQRVLDLSGTRVYDGTGAASSGDLTTIGGLVGSETVVLGGTGAVGDKNVGAGKALTSLGDLTLSDGGNGGLASNYTLAGGTDTLTITPRQLTDTIVASGKTYDGSTVATLTSATLESDNGSSGLIAGDDVSLVNPTVGSFGSKNAGTGITVTGDGQIAGGDAGNYAFTAGTTTADIDKAVLSLSGTRVYDGTGAASSSDLTTISGLVGSETVVLGGTGAVGDKNVGTGKALTSLGDLTLSDGGNGGLASNYTLTGGTDTLTITPKAITVDATAENKTYDGDDTAIVSLLTSGGVIGTDTVDFADTSASFSDANAGTGKTVTVNGITASGADAGNYTFNTVATTTADIDKAVLSLSGTRVYDGTGAASSSDLTTISGLVGNETVVLSGTGAVGDKNVGANKALTGLGNLTLSDGSNGGLAGNYTLTGGTDTLTITPRQLTDTIVASGKTYDGSTAATLTSATLESDNGSSGLIAGDDVSLVNPTEGSFGSKNAGTGITVTGDGQIAGGDAGNYAFTAGTTTADIDKAVLSLSGTRVYDGTSAASSGDLTTISGLVGGETVVLGGTGAVGDKNVGTGKALTSLGDLALSDGGNGGLASNYTLTGGTDTLTITPATLTVTGTTVSTKTYDGNTTASLGGSQLAGVLGNDIVTLGNDTTGTFASPNAATGIGVGTGMTIGGSDAGNYVLVQPKGVTGTIVPVVLDLHGTRVYDATTNAYAGLFGSNGVLAGINGETVVLNGTGQVASKNVGTYTGAQFGLGTLALADGGNGGLARNYTLAGGTDVLAITPLAIVINATGTNKMFDNTTTDVVTLSSNGVPPGDQLGFGYGAANFADPNVANGKTVTVTGLVLNGVDAGNYVITNPDATAYTTADITGARPSAFGIGDGTLASLGSVLGPTELATPYGLAPQDTVGPFNGNKKRLHRPVERNVSRDDFTSGLALKVIDGGVRAPVMAMP